MESPRVEQAADDAQRPEDGRGSEEETNPEEQGTNDLELWGLLGQV